MSERTDIELIKAFQQGDTSALGLLIDKYKKPLHCYITSMVKSESAADDIFQEVFLKIVKTPSVYKESGSFKAWLFTVSRNKCMDYFRANSGGQISLDMELADGEGTLHDIIKSEEADPLDALLSQETGAFVEEALGSLSIEQREIIILKQSMSFKEIANMLDAPLGTVLARASRGYKKMQEYINAQISDKEAAYAGR